jgi:hypothetical protein
MLRRLSFLACLLALAPGCYSKITAYEGNFTIGYASAVQIENFVKPIAPGAKLDLVVFANGTAEKLPILEVTSSKPGVLKVVAVRGTTFVVAGVAPGVSELTIAARDASGKRVTDKMFFHVAKPATHAIEHVCTEEPKAAYIRGTEVAVFHGLATADKRPVIGYDYVPLTIAPESALKFVAQPQAGSIYRYRAVKSNPAVTIKSNIDDKQLTARIVEPSEIKTARLFAPERMLAGGSAYVVGHVELADGTPVCSQNALTRARSLTPEICKVTAKLEDSLDDTNREQLAEVAALKYGTCELEMTFPELGDRGLVLKQSIKVGRVEYPSAGSPADPARHFPTWPLWLFLALAQLVSVGALARMRRR